MTSDPCLRHEKPQVNGLAQPMSASARPATLLDTCNDLRRKVDALLEESGDEALRKVQHRVRESIAVIEEALGRYGVEHLSLAYNGGKDCLVLLVLILACLSRWASSPAASTRANSSNGAVSNSNNTSALAEQVDPAPLPTSKAKHTGLPRLIQAVYVAAPHPFPEVEAFVASSAGDYHLDVTRYTLPIKHAMEAYLAERTAVKAIFVGTRRADPHGERLTHFDRTDKGWPDFMRVHPVIDWHYTEIWTFLRRLRIPVCELYNVGYTSLGSMTDTHPNPALAVAGDKTAFRPAYELTDEGNERLGRDR